MDICNYNDLPLQVLGHDRYLYHMLMCKSLIRGDYVCFICRKSFRNSGSLKTHLLLHTGAKPFPCNYCSASFRQRHHRSHHERSVHLMQGLGGGVAVEQPAETPAVNDAEQASATTPSDGSRPFPCGFCNAAFRQSNHRSYHERVIHGVDRRTRQPKGGPPPRPSASGSGGSAGKGANGGARKSVSKPTASSNGFITSPSAADEMEDDEGEMEEDEVEDAEADDLPEEDIEEGAEDIDAEGEELADEDEAASPEVEAEAEADDDEEPGEEEDEEEVAEEEEEEDQEPGSPSATENKAGSDADD